MTDADLHRVAGSLADARHELALGPDEAGWAYSGLRIVGLPSGGTHELSTGEDEVVVLPLEGSCAVTCDGEQFDLHGRTDVFSGPSDFAYVPRHADASIETSTGGRFALCAARARDDFPFRYGPADDIPNELRGAGTNSRRIRDFCGPTSFEASNLIAVEVITPGGNWSSYPPHKHDEHSDDEVPLEEIYYFEVAPGPDETPGMAYQRVYGTDERPIDVLAEVRSGDVVLIPHGYHGPSMAAPGYDLYYLNVMAGPGPERAWRICDDPAHTWVRSTWEGQDVDPRLLEGA